jgi:DNA-binding MarR family transcriptional regulator
MRDIFGVEDMAGLELYRHLKAVTHLLGYLQGEYKKDGQLSQARMRLLVRLAVATRLGNPEGISPSGLSEFLGVSRNTVSALLNGLEEQGLIERHLHPTDRRQLLVRITPAGQEQVKTRAPVFAAFVTRLFADLSAQEQETLLILLDKVLDSLAARASEMGLPAHCLESDMPLAEE